jgi:hypothetical protein
MSLITAVLAIQADARAGRIGRHAGPDFGQWTACWIARPAGYLTHVASWLLPPSIEHATGILDPTRQGGEMRMAQVTREHVLDILSRAGLTPEQEQRILALPYPVDFERVLKEFAEFGVTRDWLISRMGGSP